MSRRPELRAAHAVRPGTVRPRRHAGAAACLAVAAGLLAACGGADLGLDVATVAVCDDDTWPLATLDARLDEGAATDVFVACSQEVGASGGPGFVERLVPDDDAPAPLRSVGAVARFDHGVTGLAAGDLDGDGGHELVATVAGPSERRLAVLSADGDGNLVSLAEHTTGSTLSGPALADVDGDGALDVLSPSEGAWFANLGDATSPGPFERRTLVTVDRRLQLDRADVSGDGHADVVHRDAEEGRLRIYARSPDVPDTLPLPDAASFRTIYAGAGWDNDGAATLVAGRDVDPFRAEVVILRSDEANGLDASDPLEALGHPERAMLADLTGDGRLELVSTPRPGPDADAERLMVAPGLADGGFDDPVELRLDEFAYQPVVARGFAGDDRDAVLAVQQEARQLVVVLAAGD